MLAKRKSDGKVIEVKEWRGASDVIYSELDMNAFYEASDLDFSIDDTKEAKETVISGWVARDKKDNALNLHAEEPYRTQSGYQQGDEPDWWESECASFLPLDKGLFPDLTWDSDPIEVEIIIKRKNNENNSEPSA